jgi:glucose/mannose-6-phosphate isomerase
MKKEKNMINMHGLIYNLPEQVQEAYQISKKSKITVQQANIKNIVVAGMGGSGISGNIIKGLSYRHSKIPIITVKDYNLPGFVSKRTLFFAISYSGNTEETLECFYTARKIGCPVIAISSGGQLLSECKKYNYDFIEIPKGFPSRVAVGYLFIPLLVSLSKIGIVPKMDASIKETIKLLFAFRRKYDNSAKVFAHRLSKSIPIIYTNSSTFVPIAMRWQAQFNENAKIICHFNVFPELNHNEIVGICDNNPASALYYLILMDNKAHQRNLLRTELTLDIIKKQASKKEGLYQYQKFYPDGKSDLTRIFSLIMKGDLLSFHLARARGIEPGPILPIDELKQSMKTCRLVDSKVIRLKD